MQWLCWKLCDSWSEVTKPHQETGAIHRKTPEQKWKEGLQVSLGWPFARPSGMVRGVHRKSRRYRSASTRTFLMTQSRNVLQKWHAGSTVFILTSQETETAKYARGPRWQGHWAENFGDLITTDHKVLNEEGVSRNNHRCTVVFQDLASQWIQFFFLSVWSEDFTWDGEKFVKILGAVAQTESCMYRQLDWIRESMWRYVMESPHFNTSSIRDKWHRCKSRSTRKRRYFSSIATGQGWMKGGGPIQWECYCKDTRRNFAPRKTRLQGSMGLGEKCLQFQKNMKATFYCPIEARATPAPTSRSPEEREFVEDSGASMHMLSIKDLNSDEMDTLRRSRNPTTVVTAIGEVQTNEEAQVYVHDLDLFVKVHILDDTLAVLSLRKFCEKHGYTCGWTSGQEPHLTKQGKKILCKTEIFVPLFVPRLSSNSWYQFVLHIATAGLVTYIFKSSTRAKWRSRTRKLARFIKNTRTEMKKGISCEPRMTVCETFRNG